MFRKIKKLYFKIYHLFKLIGVFIVVFGLCDRVYADECNNLYKGEPGKLYVNVSDDYTNIFSSLDSISTYGLSRRSTCNLETTLCTNTTKSYIFYAIDQNYNLVDLIDSNMYRFNLSSQTYLNSSSQVTYLSLTQANISQVFQYTYLTTNLSQSRLDYLQSLQFYVIEGTEPCIPTPEPPPEPEPETNVYSGFLTIYFDRIIYLAEGFTNNPYLIAMVGIIFGFVVLDILLKILHIRRKKK